MFWRLAQDGTLVEQPPPEGCADGLCRAPPRRETPAAHAFGAAAAAPVTSERANMRLVKTVRITVLPTERQAMIPGFDEAMTRPIEEIAWWCEDHGVRFVLTTTEPKRDRETAAQLSLSFRDGTDPQP